MKIQKFPLPEFRAWVIENGGIITNSASAFELLRYIHPSNKLGFIHRSNSEKSHVKLSGSAIGDYKRYQSHLPLVGPLKGSGRAGIVDRLTCRDGPGCFYCGNQDLSPTVEHILARSQGGGNTLHNLCLACEPCNLAVGDKPITEKMMFYATHQLARYRSTLP